MRFKIFAAAIALMSTLGAGAAPQTSYNTLDVDGVKVFYREAGDPAKPTIVLLHGFPASSQMYAGLMDRLADRYHLVAPDYPGAGYTTVGEGAKFTPTFDGVADVMARFMQKKGLGKVTLYLQDFGGPVGFRIAAQHPDWVSALIVQNANAYEEGLSDKLRGNIAALKPGVNAQTRPALEGILSPPSVRFMYTFGTRNKEQLNPDSWLLADAGLLPEANRLVQMQLLADYHTNVAAYPVWQDYFRKVQPPTLVVWGKNDPLFTEAGAKAFSRDIKKAEVHLLNTGHFALEEDGAEIADKVGTFLAKTVR